MILHVYLSHCYLHYTSSRTLYVITYMYMYSYWNQDHVPLDLSNHFHTVVHYGIHQSESAL